MLCAADAAASADADDLYMVFQVSIESLTAATTTTTTTTTTTMISIHYISAVLLSIVYTP